MLNAVSDNKTLFLLTNVITKGASHARRNLNRIHRGPNRPSYIDVIANTDGSGDYLLGTAFLTAGASCRTFHKLLSLVPSRVSYSIKEVVGSLV